jgi:ACS family sodium-dependent inorganic phosphate cotransporter
MWLPKYLVDVVGVPLESSGFVLMLPYLLPFLGANVGGQVADRLLASGMKQGNVRKTMEIISATFSVTCVGYFVVVKEPSVTVFIVLNSLSNFFGAFALAGYWSNILDIAPRYAGTVLGISNTFASLPGIFANLLTGYILDLTGSWQLVFGIACAIKLVGVTTFVCYARGEVIFE